LPRKKEAERRLALLKDINTRVAAAAGLSPNDMLITLYEAPGENISFGQGGCSAPPPLCAPKGMTKPSDEA
jgi:hypothetical protein